MNRIASIMVASAFVSAAARPQLNRDERNRGWGIMQVQYSGMPAGGEAQSLRAAFASRESNV